MRYEIEMLYSIISHYFTWFYFIHLQAILFSLASHPEFPSFKQCVTNEFLKNTEDVRMYSIFSVSAMYFAPLVVILFTYTAILIKIIRKAHQNHQPVQTDEQQQQNSTRSRQSIRFRMSIRNMSGEFRNNFWYTGYFLEQGDEVNLVNCIKVESIPQHWYIFVFHGSAVKITKILQ